MEPPAYAVRGSDGKPLLVQDFYFLKPSDIEVLKKQLTEEPEAPAALAVLLKQYLHSLQNPPGSGRYSELTIAEEVVVISAYMILTGLWKKVNREEFVAGLHPETPSEVIELLRDYEPASLRSMASTCRELA